MTNKTSPCSTQPHPCSGLHRLPATPTARRAFYPHQIYAAYRDAPTAPMRYVKRSLLFLNPLCMCVHCTCRVTYLLLVSRGALTKSSQKMVPRHPRLSSFDASTCFRGCRCLFFLQMNAACLMHSTKTMQPSQVQRKRLAPAEAETMESMWWSSAYI